MMHCAARRLLHQRWPQQVAAAPCHAHCVLSLPVHLLLLFLRHAMPACSYQGIIRAGGGTRQGRTCACSAFLCSYCCSACWSPCLPAATRAPLGQTRQDQCCTAHSAILRISCCSSSFPTLTCSCQGIVGAEDLARARPSASILHATIACSCQRHCQRDAMSAFYGICSIFSEPSAAGHKDCRNVGDSMSSFAIEP